MIHRRILPEEWLTPQALRFVPICKGRSNGGGWCCRGATALVSVKRGWKHGRTVLRRTSASWTRVARGFRASRRGRWSVARCYPLRSVILTIVTDYVTRQVLRREGNDKQTHRSLSRALFIASLIVPLALLSPSAQQFDLTAAYRLTLTIRRLLDRQGARARALQIHAVERVRKGNSVGYRGEYARDRSRAPPRSAGDVIPEVGQAGLTCVGVQVRTTGGCVRVCKYDA